MTEVSESYQKGSNPKVDKLLDWAQKLGLEREVLQTTNQALGKHSTYSHIYPVSVEKILYRHSPRMQADPEFARTMMLAGFYLPYKHGVQFRGMMSALTSAQPLEALETFADNSITRANLIVAYRNLALPRSGEGYLIEENIQDCSLAISHPVLRLKSSGYFIEQFAKMLNSPTIKNLRQQYGNDALVDSALIEFAKRFVYYEVDSHREIATNNTKRLTHKIVNDHTQINFENAAPDIAFSATLPNATDAYQQIFGTKTQSPVKTPSFYHESIKSFIGRSRHHIISPQDAKKAKDLKPLEELAVA